MASKSNIHPDYMVGDLRNAKKAKLQPRPTRDFEPGMALRLLEDGGFDGNIEHAFKALDAIYAHTLQQDKQSGIRPDMQEAFDQLLNMPVGDFDVDRYHDLMRAALWLHVDRGTRSQSYDDALKMLDFFSQRQQQGLPIPKLFEMAPLEEYQKDLDGDRVIRKSDYWPLIWVKPQDRAKLLQHMVETEHPLADQALETPLRQLVFNAYGRFKEYSIAEEKKSLREIYGMAAKGAASYDTLKTLHAKMRLRHTAGNDFWLALETA